MTELSRKQYEATNQDDHTKAHTNMCTSTRRAPHGLKEHTRLRQWRTSRQGDNAHDVTAAHPKRGSHLNNAALAAACSKTGEHALARASPLMKCAVPLEKRPLATKTGKPDSQKTQRRRTAAWIANLVMRSGSDDGRIWDKVERFPGAQRRRTHVE